MKGKPQTALLIKMIKILLWELETCIVVLVSLLLTLNKLLTLL